MYPKKINVQDKNVIIEVWDTAGQEKFRSISPLFYRNALGCISVFEATSEDSLKDCFDYVNDFLDSVPDGNVVICANKIDLIETDLSSDPLIIDAQRMCDQEKFSFVVASAKTGEGIEEVFLSIANQITKQLNPNLFDENTININSIW